ncbi:MAG: MBL fold metallo-hydrolase, partial [Acidobacteria bacterium]|nr:MBL fold metallo-hydrolase [Acidobacteriota bacterium]
MDPRPLLRGSIVLGLVAALAAPASAQYLRIYYPDIEQGSSTLVVSPTGKALLMDAGTGLNPTDEAVEDFINDLADAGIVTSLDYVIASHYDEDHIGRLENVFQLGPVVPTTIAYDRGTFGSTPSTFAYNDYAFSAGMYNRTTIDPFTVLDLGGGVTVRCYVVNGDLPNGTSEDISVSGQFENSASVAVVVHYGDFDAWIGGDLTGNIDFGVADVESAVAPFAGDVDIYTFNHHGSRSSSTAAFLNTLKAEVGINQNSASNNFGHPTTEVVNRFLSTLTTSGGSP